MSTFTNLYYKRTTGTPRPCYVCDRPTTTVLATKDSVDFLYTCDGHLSDPGFASPLGISGDTAAGARKLGLTDEEIQKVKEDWEARQKEKEKEKEKSDKKDEKVDDSKDKASDSKDVEKKSDDSEKKSSSTPAKSPTPTPAHSHPRYTLHRDYFDMRLRFHRKKRQTAQAKEIAPRLPVAPRSSVIGNLPGSS